MFKSSKDDDQVFMVFFGTRNGTEDNPNECTSVFMGILAVAIVMMLFVGLINDSERRRFQYQDARPVNTFSRFN
ncbi:hypothetical protein OsccyDRAFT_3459 [Leptolyngbyaceae cyanobacterium JSC-12]|nr:hypothetical protein OsccyDRAFT_3459 [Leptolyngbyaceae cyanobacterium JSC-12]